MSYSRCGTDPTLTGLLGPQLYAPHLLLPLPIPSCNAHGCFFHQMEQFLSGVCFSTHSDPASGPAEGRSGPSQTDPNFSPVAQERAWCAPLLNTLQLPERVSLLAQFKDFLLNPFQLNLVVQMVRRAPSEPKVFLRILTTCSICQDWLEPWQSYNA